MYHLIYWSRFELSGPRERAQTEEYCEFLVTDLESEKFDDIQN